MPSDVALEELLSRPTAAVVEAIRGVCDGLLILGAGGKMGPSLARLARRASREAGEECRVVAVARFTNPGLEQALRADGIETIRCDLFDAAQVAALPDLPNLVFMAGQKFGTSDNAPQTWAVNAYLPGVIATRFPSARIVAYSTGNVYPLSDATGEGPRETDPVGPVGEYAQSALARERVLEFFSRTQPTSMAILRLNYAIEPRYGVLRDLADRIVGRRPIDLAMGRVNLIWQRDANAIALRVFAHCASPPLVLNLTGRPAYGVRWLAEELERRLGVEPRFTGTEAETALLSDAGRCEALFGPPEVGISEMLDQVAEWVAQGGRSLGRPTHYESREGQF
ncbi:MAG TPA: NAD(P)-dependent oxidoreductase [Gemmatimonadales bacterium]|nr:NAD(P)-dependent oxidoreductase [Gemmatimonadales bacterium]